MHTCERASTLCAAEALEIRRHRRDRDVVVDVDDADDADDAIIV